MNHVHCKQNRGSRDAETKDVSCRDILRSDVRNIKDRDQSCDHLCIARAIIITLSLIKQNHELAFFISFITESVTHVVNFSCCLPMNRELSHENSLCFATDSSLKIPKFFSKINYFKIETICYDRRLKLGKISILIFPDQFL